jgi:hypothetical protein
MSGFFSYWLLSSVLLLLPFHFFFFCSLFSLANSAPTGTSAFSREPF